MITPACPRAALLDQTHHFTDGGPCGDHVIDDQDITGQRSPYDVAAFAVGLGLFAVERVGHVAVMVVGQGRRGDRR